MDANATHVTCRVGRNDGTGNTAAAVVAFVDCSNVAFCKQAGTTSQQSGAYMFNASQGPMVNSIVDVAILDVNGVPAPHVAPGEQVTINASGLIYGDDDSTGCENNVTGFCITVTVGDFDAAVASVSDELVVVTIPLVSYGISSLVVKHGYYGDSQLFDVMVFPKVNATDIVSGVNGGAHANISGVGLNGYIAIDQTPLSIGCVQNVGLYPAASAGPFFNTTTTGCRDLCTEYQYFGLAGGDTCHCYDSELEYVEVTSSYCDTTCVGADGGDDYTCGDADGNYVTLWEKCCFPTVSLEPLTNASYELNNTYTYGSVSKTYTASQWSGWHISYLFDNNLGTAWLSAEYPTTAVLVAYSCLLYTSPSPRDRG